MTDAMAALLHEAYRERKSRGNRQRWFESTHASRKKAAAWSLGAQEPGPVRSVAAES